MANRGNCVKISAWPFWLPANTDKHEESEGKISFKLARWEVLLIFVFLVFLWRMSHYGIHYLIAKKRPTIYADAFIRRAGNEPDFLHVHLKRSCGSEATLYPEHAVTCCVAEKRRREVRRTSRPNFPADLLAVKRRLFHVPRDLSYAVLF